MFHYLIQSFVYRLPDSQIRDNLLWKIRLKTYEAWLTELVNLPVKASGVDNDNDLPFMRLENNTLLFGRFPTEFQLEAYKRWKAYMPPQITPETVGVAVDVVTRYLYPHAMPQLTLPYSKRQRAVFGHRQHTDTIQDLPNLTEKEKAQLSDIFTPKVGETFLDIGSYMGYGATRMSQLLGDSGKVIAVEADPDNLKILNANLAHNRIENVTVVPKAIWKFTGELKLRKRGRQANSLVQEVVDVDNAISVPTTTVDDLLTETKTQNVNLVSLTVNGAEVEAIRGMQSTLQDATNIRIRAAGWYERKGEKVWCIIAPMLKDYGYQVASGREGGLLAWKT